MNADTLGHDLAWIHASVEVDPQQDGSCFFTCLDHPRGQRDDIPSHGLSVTCVIEMQPDGRYSRVLA